MLPVEPFFTEDFTIPATHVTAGGVETDCDVTYDESQELQEGEDERYIDSNPRALCMSKDIPDALAGETIRLHDAITDENGNEITDEQGATLIGECLERYTINHILRNEEGVTELVLSKDP